MKKINNELKQIVKKVNGKLLMIGNYSDDVNNFILNNKGILFCEQLTNKNNKFSTSKDRGKSKKVNIKKIRKRYKKNGLDYLFVEEEQIKDFKNTFIKDSIYIVKNKIYFIKTKESERIISRYYRYSKNIETLSCIDGEIVSIDVSNCKTIKCGLILLVT